MPDSILDRLANPPREYSLMPFWFWNDELDAAEIVRQIADFDAHGVYGFVIHPRVGLPRTIGWMSDAMLGFMKVAIDEARRREMKVILYDEGMYPSGSSSGQVVERDPNLACRCLALHMATDALPADANIVGEFTRGGVAYRVVDRKADSVIRGLHYLDESQPRTPGKDPPEESPAAADILNPNSTQTFIELVHDRFTEEFGDDFSKTIIGIFTDEPSALGRPREKNIRAGTTGILPELHRLTGHDFTDDLQALFFDDEPNAAAIRERYAHAIRARLEETWYAPLHDWCERNGLWLMGHPDAGDEIGVQRHFHCPGQDLVWRWVEPGNANSIEGRESTQGKCSSSAMLHAGRSRNSNEFAGAYGHETTFAEVEWLADWCFVRGVNLLIPHAFYYTVRGPRKDERPPQLGPHTPEWNDGTFKRFAERCRRLSWLNATSEHVCDVAILTHDDQCPWPAAKACFERQRDFNYLEPRVLLEASTRVSDDAITVGSMRYSMLILDGDIPLSNDLRKKLATFIAAGRVIRFGTRASDGIDATADGDDLIERVRRECGDDVQVATRAPGLRVRHVRQGGDDFFLFFNERETTLETAVTLRVRGVIRPIDLITGSAGEPLVSAAIQLNPWEATLWHIGAR